MASRTITLRAAAARYRAIVRAATPAELESAAVWYSDAERTARDIADIIGRHTDAGAAILAAYSPQTSWADNVRRAYRFALHAEHDPVFWPGGLLATPEVLRACVERGADALSGPKVSAFARAIAGDSEAVVIDLWMARAARLRTDSPTTAQYRVLAEAVRVVARQEGLTPRTAQALIWIRVRGSAH